MSARNAVLKYTALEIEENRLCDELDELSVQVDQLKAEKRELTDKLKAVRAARKEAEQARKGMKSAPIASLDQYARVKNELLSHREAVIHLRAAIAGVEDSIAPRTAATQRIEARLEAIEKEYAAYGKLLFLPPRNRP